jgi:hypothetical protein
LFAAAVALWLVDCLLRRSLPRPRLFHLALGLYLALAMLSMALAADQTTARETVLLMFELGAIAVLTSAFGTQPDRLKKIVVTLCAVSLYTALLTIVGLALFYLGHTTSLIGDYGGVTPSDAYARVAAGFYSAPLLSSYCIFASAVVAREDVEIAPWLRLTTQFALAFVVLTTISRGIIGFAVAAAIRAGARHRNRAWVRVAVPAFVVAAVAVTGALSLGRLHLDLAHPSAVSYDATYPHWRRETIDTSLHTLASHPVAGTGPGSLPGIDTGEPARAHLTPLNIAATMGLPALAAFIFLIAVLWRDRRRPTPIATWSGMAGLAVDGLAQDIDHFRSTWLMIGFADADRREPAEDP